MIRSVQVGAGIDDRGAAQVVELNALDTQPRHFLSSSGSEAAPAPVLAERGQQAPADVLPLLPS